MTTVNVREARERISQLLDDVAAGEEVLILRHGKPAAKLVAATVERARFPERRELRESMPPMREPAGRVVRALRDEERF